MNKQDIARKGGLARAASLNAKQRSANARKAVLARWAKEKRLLIDPPQTHYSGQGVTMYVNCYR